MDENILKHESYGMLGFSRVTSCGTTLFGSSIKHNSTIQMTVKTAEVNRHLSQNWYYGRNHIVTVEMSPTQFYEAIANMNVGDGVPVTIRRLNGEGISDCPFDDVRKKFEREFSENIKQANDNTQLAIAKVSQMLSNKKSMNKSEKEELLNLLSQIQMGITSSSEFIYEQFNEQMDKTVSEAKGEVEAFVQNKIMSYGIEGIKQEAFAMLCDNSEEKGE